MPKRSRKKAVKSHIREKKKFKPFRIFRILRGLMFGDHCPKNAKQWAAFDKQFSAMMKDGVDDVLYSRHARK